MSGIAGSNAVLLHKVAGWRVILRIVTMRVRLLTLGALLCFPACAGEYVILSTGFAVHAERHETVGDKVVVHTKDGSLEFAAAAVAEFQPEEKVQPPPAASPAPPAAPVPPPADPQQLVTDAAIHQGLPPAFVHSVAKVESNYDLKAVSPKGARGVMQLMPSTARKLDADPEDPQQNVEAGTRYLRELLIRYQSDPEPVRRALAAYNAGPAAVDKYNGVPPYPETQLYVEKVLQTYWKQVKK